jgi:hypothetical protein
VCVWIQKERERWMFSPPRPVTVVFFSPLSTSRFFSFWKRDFLLFLPPVRRRHNPKKTLQNKLKKGRSRHILLSVVSRSPGKLFKRTLTYRGKRTQRYVKREREREKRRRGAFSPSSCPGCSKNAGWKSGAKKKGILRTNYVSLISPRRRRRRKGKRAKIYVVLSAAARDDVGGNGKNNAEDDDDDQDDDKDNRCGR